LAAAGPIKDVSSAEKKDQAADSEAVARRAKKIIFLVFFRTIYPTHTIQMA
jgi:hypothetical protein